MNTWHSVDNPPPLSTGEYGWLSSNPVLVYDKYGDYRVATLEQMDEDLEPIWYEQSFERWKLTAITHWQFLPEPPHKGVKQ